MTTTAVIALLATQASGAAGVSAPLVDSRAQGSGSRVTAPEKCPARKAVKFYARRISEHRARMGAIQGAGREERLNDSGLLKCPRYLAHVLQRKARVWRLRADRYITYNYHWQVWLPAKWYRIARCETGVRWGWNSGTYQGAFGFYHGSWDAFRLPGYPSEAYDATPRQQYEVALAIWRRYRFSGWGCRNA